MNSAPDDVRADDGWSAAPVALVLHEPTTPEPADPLRVRPWWATFLVSVPIQWLCTLGLWPALSFFTYYKICPERNEPGVMLVFAFCVLALIPPVILGLCASLLVSFLLRRVALPWLFLVSLAVAVGPYPIYIGWSLAFYFWQIR